MPVSRPYDPANYTTVREAVAYAVELEDRIAELEAALQKWRAQPEREVHDPWVVISAREIDDLLQKTPRE